MGNLVKVLTTPGHVTYRLHRIASHRSAAFQCLIACRSLGRFTISACLFMGVKLQISNSSSAEERNTKGQARQAWEEPRPDRARPATHSLGNSAACEAAETPMGFFFALAWLSQWVAL